MILICMSVKEDRGIEAKETLDPLVQAFSSYSLNIFLLALFFHILSKFVFNLVSSKYLTLPHMHCIWQIL